MSEYTPHAQLNSTFIPQSHTHAVLPRVVRSYDSCPGGVTSTASLPPARFLMLRVGRVSLWIAPAPPPHSRGMVISRRSRGAPPATVGSLPPSVSSSFMHQLARRPDPHRGRCEVSEGASGGRRSRVGAPRLELRSRQLNAAHLQAGDDGGASGTPAPERRRAAVQACRHGSRRLRSLLGLGIRRDPGSFGSEFGANSRNTEFGANSVSLSGWPALAGGPRGSRRS